MGEENERTGGPDAFRIFFMRFCIKERIVGPLCPSVRPSIRLSVIPIFVRVKPLNRFEINLEVWFPMTAAQKFSFILKYTFFVWLL